MSINLGGLGDEQEEIEFSPVPVEAPVEVPTVPVPDRELEPA